MNSRFFRSCFWFLSIVLFTSFQSFYKVKRQQISGFAQGTTWQLVYYASDSLIKKDKIDSIFKEIDSSMSLYQPNSLINTFNKSERGVKMDKHLKTVIEKSLAIYKESTGVFDITVKPLVQVWGFGVNKTTVSPDKKLINSILPCIGSDKIAVKQDSLIKLKKCLEIDVNGIAQGYTVDVIAAFLEQNRIDNYVVEVGGEVRVKGTKIEESFKIGIEMPNNGVEALQKIITVSDGAITTSGNYRKYKLQGGKKISHLIDSKSGYPTQNELISVTVLAKDAITSDGYDNVFMNIGLKKSLTYLQTRKDIAAYFIYLKDDKTVGDTASAGFNKFFNKH